MDTIYRVAAVDMYSEYTQQDFESLALAEFAFREAQNEMYPPFDIVWLFRVYNQDGKLVGIPKLLAYWERDDE